MALVSKISASTQDFDFIAPKTRRPRYGSLRPRDRGLDADFSARFSTLIEIDFNPQYGYTGINQKTGLLMHAGGIFGGRI